jgi:predicted alpha/beta hydrolase family esterase
MKNAIIVHGTPDREEYYDGNVPSCSNAHWLPWLQKQLLLLDIPTATPEMPFAFDPQYDIWQREFERFDIGPETILVGHSCGGGFLLRWLCEHQDVRVHTVVLVAPWIDPRQSKRKEFFEFALDRNVTSRAEKFVVFNSDDDMESILESVAIILENVDNIDYREFQDYGHFCSEDLGSDEFHELLECIVSDLDAE